MHTSRKFTACSALAAVSLLLLTSLTHCGQQHQQLPAAAQANSRHLLTSGVCTTSGNTTYCTLVDFASLPSLALAPGQRLVIASAANDSFTNLTLDSSSPLFIGAGAKLELWNVQLGPVSFSATATDPTASLSIKGIVLSNETRLPASLIISNSKLLLECSSWNVLQSSVCMHGRSAGDVEVTQSTMNVSSFRAGGIQWRNVTILSACDASLPTPAASFVPCVVRTETDGGKLLEDLASLQARSFVNIQFIAATSLVLPPPKTNWAAITANLTISGNGNIATLLDVNLQPLVFSVQPGGSLTLRNLVILNLSPRADKYPLGLLTCMMWFVVLNKNDSSVDQLVVANSTILVPEPEFAYLQQALDPSSIAPSWTSGPNALFHEPPVVYSNASTLLMDASGSQGLWLGVALMVLDFAPGVAAKIIWTGLDALLLPSEAPSDLDLPLVQVLAPQLDLSQLPSQPGTARLIMNQSIALAKNASNSMPQPVQLMADVILVGNPVHPEQAVLDLQGLTCLPATLPGSPEGFITIRDPLSLGAPTLYLRDLVLVNALPLGSVSSDPALGSQTDSLVAMSNYSSLLWLFNIDRFSSDPNVTLNATVTPGALVLDNVTLVLPVAEFRVILQIVKGSLKNSINQLAYQLMRQELVQMEAAAQLLLPALHISFEQSVGVGLLDGSSSDLGTLTFPVFSWFGMTGTYVKFTSERPALFTGTLLTLNTTLFTTVSRSSSPSPSAPTASPSPPAPSPLRLHSPDDAVAGDSGPWGGWRLGVLVAGCVLGAALLAAAAFWGARAALQARNAGGPMDGEPKCTCTTPSNAKDNVSVDTELVLGGADADASTSPAARLSVFSGQARVCFSKSCLASLTSIKVVDPDPLHEERTAGSLTRGSLSGSSHRGSLGEAAAGAVRSPFEAVALGLASMAVSAVALELAPEPCSPGQGSVPRTGDAPTSAPEPGGDARLDTGALLAKIFGSADAVAECGGRAGGGGAGTETALSPPGLRLAQDGFLSASSESGLCATHSHLPTPTGSMLQEIQRQMECLREELGSGCDEAPQWSIQGQLGKGAHGVVYKGTWRGLDVAIKRVIFQVMGNPVADAKRKTTLREAAINGTLDHPNIVTTYTHDMRPLNHMPLGRGAGIQPFADWQLFIIQEFCECGSLFAAIQQQRFWDGARQQPLLPAVLSIASDIASGCAYIHSKNIIHGDLKPDNVLLKFNSGGPAAPKDPGSGPGPASTSTAKIADFGMSVRIMENRTHVSGVHHGTPLYIAPEILQEGRASTAADVYSYGIILWELFHGISAWEHLVRSVGTPRKHGSFPAFHPGLFTFNKCSLPAYSRLGRACLSNNPLERPSFLQVLESLQGIAEELNQGVTAATGRDYTAGAAGSEGQLCRRSSSAPFVVTPGPGPLMRLWE